MTFSIQMVFRNTDTSVTIRSPFFFYNEQKQCYNLTTSETDRLFNINPINLLFLIFYLSIISIQLICMLIHRWSTIITLLGKTKLFFEGFSFSVFLDQVYVRFRENDACAQRDVFGFSQKKSRLIKCYFRTFFPLFFQIWR